MGPADAPPSSPAVSNHVAASLNQPCPGHAPRHILVPLDGSSLAERAVAYVAAVGKGASARVTLLRVLTPTAGPLATDALDWEIQRREAAAYLAKIQADLAAAGIKASVEIVQGKPSEQVLHLAAASDVDLIVLSSHGEGGVGQWSLSSTAHKVITSSSTSLLIVPVRAHQEEVSLDLRFRKVLVALDCSSRSECTLPTATEIARAHHADLILANVVPEPELPRRVSPSAHDLELAQELTEGNRREAVRYLRELQKRLTGSTDRVQMRTVVSGRSAQALRDLAQHEDVDLIVVSAHGVTGDPATPYGTVAGRLLQEADRPVIVVQDLVTSARESRAPLAATRIQSR